jgi:hypothetical protein
MALLLEIIFTAVFEVLAWAFEGAWREKRDVHRERRDALKRERAGHD